MIVQCTTAELPTLLPMLAGLNHAFKLDVTDAPKARTETVAVPAAPAAAPVKVEPAPAVDAVRAEPVVQAAPVAPAPATVAVTAGKARWYSTDEVGAIVGSTNTKRTVRLMQRAGIDAILMNQSGKRGDTRNYFDAEKVDALKRDLDATWSVQDAAELMGDKSTVPIQYHTDRRRITPTIVAGQVRYKTEDLHELMRYRKIA
ncbi:hypothetical protein [Burkholderia gladioli]|uniref:hypothetical protein n=1 Tax=Burkholderia gladioli TaxID=28095 RepID=UPI0016407AF3|nr:hypothetical protein [Burkholderia gladioli]